MEFLGEFVNNKCHETLNLKETFYRFLKLNSKYKMKIPDHRLTTNK